MTNFFSYPVDCSDIWVRPTKMVLLTVPVSCQARQCASHLITERKNLCDSEQAKENKCQTSGLRAQLAREEGCWSQ